MPIQRISTSRSVESVSYRLPVCAVLIHGYHRDCRCDCIRLYASIIIGVALFYGFQSIMRSISAQQLETISIITFAPFPPVPSPSVEGDPRRAVNTVPINCMPGRVVHNDRTGPGRAGEVYLQSTDYVTPRFSYLLNH